MVNTSMLDRLYNCGMEENMLGFRISRFFLRSIMIKLPPDCVIGSTRKFRGAAHTSMVQLDQVILLVPTMFLQLLNEDLEWVFAAP